MRLATSNHRTQGPSAENIEQKRSWKAVCPDEPVTVWKSTIVLEIVSWQRHSCFLDTSYLSTC